MDNWISFPSLGIGSFTEGLQITPYLQIFNFRIYWYGIIICFALILGMVLGLKFCTKYGIEQDTVLDYLITALPSAIIFARLYYIAFNLDYYFSDPIKMLYIWEGGLAIYGGIIGAALAILITSKIRKDRFFHIMDFALPYIMLGQALGRWGNFFNQEAYGTATTLSFGMTGNVIQEEMGSGVMVHPTFLYESAWCLLGFILLSVYRRHIQKKVGEVSALYMIWYGVERAAVESLRTDSLTFDVGNITFRISQLVSVALVIFGITLLIDSLAKGDKIVDVINHNNGHKIENRHGASVTDEERVNRDFAAVLDKVEQINSSRTSAAMTQQNLDAVIEEERRAAEAAAAYEAQMQYNQGMVDTMTLQGFIFDAQTTNPDVANVQNGFVQSFAAPAETSAETPAEAPAEAPAVAPAETTAEENK